MPSHLPVYLDLDLAMAQIGDVDTMNSMLLLLQEALARDVSHISELLEAGDVVGANRLLHALKGFVPIFCREDFCNRVVEVEAMSKDSQSSAVGPAYRALRPALDQLLADVNVYVDANRTT